MSGQPIELPFRDIPMILEAVFESAKRRDEFGFCRTLLRERGTNGEFVDPLFETRRYIHQHITLLEAPIEDSLKLRLMLSLYCHTVQMRDFYDLSANLLRITAGVPYAIHPFAEDTQGRALPAMTVEEKAGRIAEWAVAAGNEEFGDLVAETVVPEVRRSFVDSVYSLDERKLYYRPENGANAADCVIDLEWLLPRVNRGVAVALTFVDTAQRHLLSYQANKIVNVTLKGGTTAQMELIARGGVGLSGYRELPSEVTPAAEAPAAAPEIKPA